jgi:hypothetical protein
LANGYNTQVLVFFWKTAFIIIRLVFNYFAAQVFELVNEVRPGPCVSVDMQIAARVISNECDIGRHLDFSWLLLGLMLVMSMPTIAPAVVAAMSSTKVVHRNLDSADMGLSP